MNQYYDSFHLGLIKAKFVSFDIENEFHINIKIMKETRIYKKGEILNIYKRDFVKKAKKQKQYHIMINTIPPSEY